MKISTKIVQTLNAMQRKGGGSVNNASTATFMTHCAQALAGCMRLICQPCYEIRTKEDNFATFETSRVWCGAISEQAFVGGDEFQLPISLTLLPLFGTYLDRRQRLARCIGVKTRVPNSAFERK